MRSLYALVALVSLPVFACPNLAGNYKTCRSSNPQNSTVTEANIEQKIVNKVHQFTFTSQEVSSEEARTDKYSADGKTHTVSETDQDTGITVRTSTNASCSGNALIIRMNATIEGEAFANITIQNTKVGNQMVQVYTGTTMGEAVNETITCE